MSHERKNLGIDGAIKLPNSNYFLVPSSLWNKWKTITHGEPEVDETEVEMLVNSKGKLILGEDGEPQEVFRRRSMSNPKDVEFYKENGTKVFFTYDSLVSSNSEAGALYVGKDGKIYDPSSDIWEENIIHEKVREVGGVFVNDTYLNLFKKRRGLLFLDGSYGSGKTTFAITFLLITCLNAEKGKFNCFYGRQEKEMARQLHKNIITEIKRNHWEHLFDYSEADNGSKNIHCKKNDGLFQQFGCDDIKTIKGWDNPTHILVDEVNQIEFETFGMLQSRLRRPGVETLFIGCFNACDVIPVDLDTDGSWLWRYFFKTEKGTASDEAKRKVFKSMGVTTHHSDYLDNYCMNNFQYWYQLLVQAKFDINVANRFANGDWGTKLNAQLYYNRFKREKHVEPAVNLPYYPTLPIINGWDENTQPYQPSLICQKHGNEIWFLKEFLGYNPDNNSAGVCKMLRKEYGGFWKDDEGSGKGLDHRGGWIICGDATSKKENSSLEKGQNYFTIIQTALKQFQPEIWVQDANPSNKIRGEFVNLIFFQEVFGIKIRISEEGCPKLIEDLQNVMQDIKNEKKAGHKDKSTKIVNGVRQVQPYGHLADAMDYILCEIFMTEYLTYQAGDMTVDAVGGKRAVRNSYENDRNGRPDIPDSDQVLRNKKFRGDTNYKPLGEVPNNLNTEQLEEYLNDEINLYKKRKSKNSW